MSVPLLFLRKEDAVVRIIVSAEIMRLTKPIPLTKASYFHHKCSRTHTHVSHTYLGQSNKNKFSLARLIFLCFLTNYHLVMCHSTATSLFLRLFFYSRICASVFVWRLSHRFICGLVQWSISAEWARKTFALVKPHRPETTCCLLCKLFFLCCVLLQHSDSHFTTLLITHNLNFL